MIHIKNPCHADWQEMMPHTTGKFCAACEKVVVDFSKMNDNEIKNYFISYSDQKTCGRFLKSQVDRKLKASSKNSLRTFIYHLYTIPVLRSVIVLCVSSFIWLSSCVKHNFVQGKVAPQYDDIHNKLMGDTVIFEEPIDTSANASPKDSVTLLKDDYSNYREIRMGKVMMIDTVSQRIRKRK